MNIIEQYENTRFFLRVLNDIINMCVEMKKMEVNGYSVEDMRNRFAKDLHSECIFYAALSKMRGEYETLIRANHMCGYVVDNNEIIHCIGASSWIAQFDGCKESEIEFYHI